MKRLVSTIFVCAFLGTVPAFSQDVTGNISGTVQDSSGGAVANARITVVNTDQKITVKTLTSGNSGEYAATQLPVAMYTVTVESPGFKRASRTSVSVNVNDKLTVNFTLEVGAVTEEVKVEESPVAVEMQTSAAQSLITGTQVRELALNTRNYEQLLQLSSGVVSNVGDQVYIGTSNPLGGANTVGFSINGSRPGANNWTVDGADNVDRGSNQTLLNYPSVDAIAEFKVLRGQYDAEFGRALGGQINVVTKSGTSGFHGDGYEFFRNDKLAANNYFSNLNGVNKDPVTGKARVQPLRYNNFGYTVGGPVWIPKVYNRDKNKTFFFFSQEFRRVITYATATTTVATGPQKVGQFATPVCVSFSADGTQCLQTGTQIANINPVAQAYIKDIFAGVPNGSPFGSTAGQGSLFVGLRNQAYARQELIKIDHNFGQKLTLSGRYIRDSIPTLEPGGLFTGLALPGVANTSTNSPGKGLVVRATSSFTPNVVNEGGYAYSYGAIISRVTGSISSAASPDVKVALPYASTIARIPSLTFTSGSSVTGFGPYDDFNRNHQVFDSLTWVKGRHTMKFGGTYYHYNKTENAGGGNQGSFAFSGEGTTVRPAGTAAFDQAFANFLLGRVSTFTQTQLDLTPSIKSNSFEFYGQDQFRLRPNLTLSYGFRYSVFLAPFDDNKYLTNFNPALYDPKKAPQVNAAGNIVPNTGDPYNGLIVNSQNPAFGHVSPFGTKVSNFGKNNLAPRLGIAWDPYGDGKTSIRMGYGLFYDTALYGIYEQNIFNNPPYNNTITIPNTQFANPAAGTPSISASPRSLRGTPYQLNTPYSQQYSFDVQRQYGRGLVLDVGYYGQKGTHLLGIRDINEVPLGLAYSSGVIPTGTYVTAATTPRLNALRPYVGYGAINVLETNYNETYNSLQVNIEKRFSGHTSFGLAYTWSKGMGDTQSDRGSAPQNSLDVASERGRLAIDRTHVATANFVVDIPGFRDQKGFVGQVLGGWELSGIATFQSGLPFTATSGLGNDPGGLGFLGASAAGPRPDQACNPNNDAPRQLGQWFNTACFNEVPLGQIRPGNAGRGTIRGPGLQRWDTSLFKNFKLPITEQTSLQLRGEAFNVFNHTNYNAINTSLGSALFGRVTATRDPRIVQVALKLYF